MRYSAVDYSHQQLAMRLKPGCKCIDATAGRGHDTAFLCSLVGETGEVAAFDVQQEALDSTAKRLEELGVPCPADFRQPPPDGSIFSSGIGGRHYL